MSQESEHSQLGPSENGTVMLDIGGNIGALIITTTVSMLLAEIEVSHVDADPTAHRPHVAVRERRGPGGVQYAAIYPGLPAGEYVVWGLDGRPADKVEIAGGEVAQLDWR
jgi:hypothetical protein